MVNSNSDKMWLIVESKKNFASQKNFGRKMPKQRMRNRRRRRSSRQSRGQGAMDKTETADVVNSGQMLLIVVKSV